MQLNDYSKGLIISLCLLITAVVISIKAQAYSDSYPYPNAPTCPNNCTVDDWNFYKRECTSYAAFKADKVLGNFHNQMMGPNGLSGRFGNAGNWRHNAKYIGMQVSAEPIAGSILTIDPDREGTGNFGHVSYVEKVHSDGSFDITEYNWNGGDKSFNQRLKLKDSPHYNFIILNTSPADPTSTPRPTTPPSPTPTPDPCLPQPKQDWLIDRRCTLTKSVKADRHVRISSKGSLTITNSATLDLDLRSYQLFIDKGGKLEIKPGSHIN